MERLVYTGVKIKSLQNDNFLALEEEINEFLDQVLGHIMDIKCYFGDGKHNATIIYQSQEIKGR